MVVPPARTERVIVTLRTGAMVGEIALLDGGVRTATVRAAVVSEVLILSKKTLFDLDKGTIHSIRELAMYNKVSSALPRLCRGAGLTRAVRVAFDRRVQRSQG